MKKVSLKTVEHFIKRDAKQIESMDEKSLPMVLAELQGEQALFDVISDHRIVTEIELWTLEAVFPCYTSFEKGEEWFQEMVAFEKELQTVPQL